MVLRYECERCLERFSTPLQLRGHLADCSGLALPRFAAGVARAIGPVLCNGRWQYDVSHDPPNGRVPLTFYAAAVESNPMGSAMPLNPEQTAILGLDCLCLVPHGTPVIAVLQMTTKAVLPDQYDPARPPAESAQLFWRVLTTDSCEAVHTGVAMAIHRLRNSRPILEPWTGGRISEVGIVTARRVRPFERIVKLQLTDFEHGGAKVKPRPALPHGGQMHQLIWLGTQSGERMVCDFTGPQFGVYELLESTGSPFWCCSVADGGTRLRERYGFEQWGSPVLFGGENEVPIELLGNEMHMQIGTWIRDSILKLFKSNQQIG